MIGKSSEYDEAIIDIMEKNNALNKNVRNLRREHEIQVVRLCKETKLTNTYEEDRVMMNEDQRILSRKLEDKTYNV